MRKVIIDMQALFASAVDDALQKSGFGFLTVRSESPEETPILCRAENAEVLIMDVMSYSPRTIEERLFVRDELKRTLPECKIVLIVDENSERLAADRVRLTKKDGLIDDFIYGSVSNTYLAAVIDAL